MELTAYTEYGFWAKVAKTEDDSCWEWQGTRDADGYGVVAISFNGKKKTYRAHRLAYFLGNITQAPLDDNLVVCHTCDNRCCVRPDHLSLGTIQDNNRQRTERNPNTGQTQKRYRQKGTIEERFWARTIKTETCWLWDGQKNESGYGLFKLNWKVVRAHRLAYELTNGPIPGGLVVLHSCDVRACINPAHLSLGTRPDNLRDAQRKGRLVYHPAKIASSREGRSAVMKERAARGDAHGSKTHPERWVTGDAHWSRTNPERCATGERHGSKTHPEKVARGEASGNAKITLEQAKAIKAAYVPGVISQEEVARMYNLSQTQVSRILRGVRWPETNQ